MYKDLNNKRILIIGGSGLIGSEIVNKFRESNSTFLILTSIITTQKLIIQNMSL